MLDRSATTPVVVDLWAPWCGPCRTLGPILEKVVDETDGKVVLVKVNVDENPQVSQAFRVQGIPAVYAVAGGKVVDGFVGAQPEAAVREFVERLLPSEAEREDRRACWRRATRPRCARCWTAGPTTTTPSSPWPSCWPAGAEDGDVDEALALLGRIPETPETRRVAALVRTGAPAPDGQRPATRSRPSSTPCSTRCKADDDARQAYVDLLEVLGPDDPRTADYRKRLTRQLF